MTPGITCIHVHRGAPILHAVRDDPAHADDTGWSLFCGEAHEYEDFLIVDLDSYVSQDKFLAGILTMPPYTVASRSTGDQPWVIEGVGVAQEPETTN